MKLNCPTCGNARTIHFDHTKGATTAVCSRCTFGVQGATINITGGTWR